MKLTRYSFTLSILALVSSIAATCYTPHPPGPGPQPNPHQYRLQVYVHGPDGQPLTPSRIYRDNVATENPWKGGTPIAAGPDAGAAWDLPEQGFNVCGLYPDHTETIVCAPVPLFQNLTVTVTLGKKPEPIPPTPTPDVPHLWTRDQLRDFQGDLMLYAPEVGCNAEYEIRCDTPGLRNGWVWTLSTWRFSTAMREKLYGIAKASGWTHYPVHVTACVADGGYHGLYPTTQAQCDTFPSRINTELRELHLHNLIPVGAGAGPGNVIAPVDTTLIPMGMNAWDDSCQAWAQLQATAAAFPHALLYIEMPFECSDTPGHVVYHPLPSGGDEPVVPADGNGGAWIREAQRRYPNFLGVLHELDPDLRQFDHNGEYLDRMNTWYRDLQQVLFETDTYTKVWSTVDYHTSITQNDQLRARAPWLQGYMSSATAHPAPSDSGGGGHYDGYLQPSQVTPVGLPDFRSWPQTTELTKILIGTDDLHLTFDKQAVWPDVSFGVQYSIGMCLNRDGWVCSAPIELWTGKPGGGGPIQNQHAACPPPGPGYIGQVACNWFYDGRWGALRGQQPRTGEQIALFVLAGDARNNINPTAERSDIVLVKLPADGASAVYVR